jgi:predicted PurR-regulated permease PerM
MLGLDARAARVTWTVFLFALAVLITWQVRESILIFVAALFLAYMLSPLLDLICRFAPPRFSRTAALAIVYVFLLLVIAGAATWLGTQAVEQGAALAEQMPELIRKHRNLDAIPLPDALQPFRDRLVVMVRQQTEVSAERVLPLIQRALGGVASILGSLSFVILVPILTFLFLKDAVTIRESILAWMPRRHRALTDDILADVHFSLGQYIRALVILSILTSVVYLIFFEIVRLPYAVLVSLLAAPLEFIPFIGPLIGTLLILAIAVFTGYEHIWWLLIFFALYRAFQDYALQPYLMSEGVELHPLLVIFGALAGQQLGGLWGMFLSVPVLATLRIVLVQVQKRRKQRDLAPDTK